MIKRITAYKTKSGTIYEDRVKAEVHDFRILYSKVAASYCKNQDQYDSLFKIEKKSLVDIIELAHLAKGIQRLDIAERLKIANKNKESSGGII